MEKSVREIESRIKEIEDEIRIVKSMKDNNEEEREINEKGLELFYSRINKNEDSTNTKNRRKNKSFDALLSDLNVKNLNIEKEIKNIENEINEILKKIKDCENKINKINYENEKENIKNMKRELEIKKERIRKRENIVDDIEKNNRKNRMRMKRSVLIEKQINLNKKIGYLKDDTANDMYNNVDDIKTRLKDINEKLKKYIGLNKKVNLQYDEFVGKKDELNKRISDLKDGRLKIEEFISVLDDKKNDAVNLTLSMVKNNFEHFYHKLAGKKAELVLCDNKVEIKIENERNIKKLSGGEKTILSLSLIFSIQKIDSSPFYFFDEIDANLDKDARIKVAELIKEMCNENTQYFIVTFRREMIEIGDKFYGIEYVNRNSEIKEISKEEAISMTIDEAVQN